MNYKYNKVKTNLIQKSFEYQTYTLILYFWICRLLFFIKNKHMPN